MKEISSVRKSLDSYKIFHIPFPIDSDLVYITVIISYTKCNFLLFRNVQCLFNLLEVRFCVCQFASNLSFGKPAHLYRRIYCGYVAKLMITMTEKIKIFKSHFFCGDKQYLCIIETYASTVHISRLVCTQPNMCHMKNRSTDPWFRWFSLKQFCLWKRLWWWSLHWLGHKGKLKNAN